MSDRGGYLKVANVLFLGPSRAATKATISILQYPVLLGKMLALELPRAAKSLVEASQSKQH